MSRSLPYSKPAIAGSGEIACGLAACASSLSPTTLFARSDASAWRAEERAHSLSAKVDGGNPKRLRVTTDIAELADCDLVIEAIIEDLAAKTELLGSIGDVAGGAHLATTTSSLPISEIAAGGGHPARTVGLHPFNPVTKMELIELCVPEAAALEAGAQMKEWCHLLGKTVVEVPELRGFVVNRLLFPFLFDAVRLYETTGLEAADVDRCMTLGANHPMGPLALLDMIGLDVALAIGNALHADTGEERHAPPATISKLVKKKKLGRKSGAGFFSYG